MDFVRPYFFVERRKNIVDLTYQNNKGLYAFVMAFMIILVVFLPGTSTYASDYGTSTPTSDFKVITFKQKSMGIMKEVYTGGNYKYSFQVPKDNLVLRTSPESYKQYISKIYVKNVDTGKIYDDVYLMNSAYNDSSGYRVVMLSNKSEIVENTNLEFTYVMSKLLPKEAYGYNVYDTSNQSYFTSTSFLKTVPPPPAVIQVQKVQDLPRDLTKVAGIVTLAGCLILGTLLAVGSVRRLISLFIR